MVTSAGARDKSLLDVPLVLSAEEWRETKPVTVEVGYAVMSNGQPVDFRRMRLTEMNRRQHDVDDAGFQTISVTEAANSRYAAGLCIECGVLSRVDTLFCGACVATWDEIESVLCRHGLRETGVLRFWGECVSCVMEVEG